MRKIEKQIIDIPFDIRDLEKKDKHDRTYKMDLEKKRICGKIDGKEAVIQAIWKNLSTCRFAHLIYDDFYGSDIFHKINDNDLTPEYLDSDLPAMVEETLLMDKRILGVANFKYDIVDHDSVHISFTAATIYGEVDIEGVIANGS